MSDAAIKVEGLGKKYLLRHEAGGRSRYVALRDAQATGVAAKLTATSELGFNK
jgi:hypothetical protein